MKNVIIFVIVILLLMTCISCSHNPTNPDFIKPFKSDYVKGDLLFNIINDNDGRVVLPVIYSGGHILVLNSPKRASIIHDLTLPGEYLNDTICNTYYELSDNDKAIHLVFSLIIKDNGKYFLCAYRMDFKPTIDITYRYVLHNTDRDPLNDYISTTPILIIKQEIGEPVNLKVYCQLDKQNIENYFFICQGEHWDYLAKYDKHGRQVLKKALVYPTKFNKQIFNYLTVETLIVGYDGNWVVYYDDNFEIMTKYPAVSSKPKDSLFINESLLIRYNNTNDFYMCNLSQFPDSLNVVPKLGSINLSKLKSEFFLPIKNGTMFISKSEDGKKTALNKVSDDMCEYTYSDNMSGSKYCTICLYKTEIGYKCTMYIFDQFFLGENMDFIKMAEIGFINDDILDISSTLNDYSIDRHSIYIFCKNNVYKISVSKQFYKTTEFEIINPR
ncbi:MAG: hypothetical protein ABFD23_06325 [Caldisericales bacterium]|nr:hypothetical protein [bacterium]